MNQQPFSILKGKVLTKIEGGKDAEVINFFTMDGKKYSMFHVAFMR